MGEYINFARTLSRDKVMRGGWAEGLFDAADRGEISLDTARLMIFDYATPSLDTTIASIGEMLWRLASVDGAYDTLRAHPELVPSVVYESVRMATPIRGFTRYAIEPFQMSETTLPAGSRILLLNASANRDERHYSDPDRFDVRRNPRDHLGWGAGVHLCAGMHLARLEMEALLRAILASVARISAGEPTRLVNNGLQGFAQLPLTLHPD
ncbi:cytochrome P450 [Sphingobium xenophagum]|uniref:Cytochrome P450 n=1 Tax=Sphingobium xenophagum TaxID=121428 RepID=A0ABU1X5K7_SPHXE|nr:cytochrome P450 [Sphingobium xenophagum]MDR7156858.1 cytochrome P450 [Sphingobium xenophagum]